MLAPCSCCENYKIVFVRTICEVLNSGLLCEEEKQNETLQEQGSVIEQAWSLVFWHVFSDVVTSICNFG